MGPGRRKGALRLAVVNKRHRGIGFGCFWASSRARSFWRCGAFSPIGNVTGVEDIFAAFTGQDGRNPAYLCGEICDKLPYP